MNGATGTGPREDVCASSNSSSVVIAAALESKSELPEPCVAEKPVLPLRLGSASCRATGTVDVAAPSLHTEHALDVTSTHAIRPGELAGCIAPRVSDGRSANSSCVRLLLPSSELLALLSVEGFFGQLAKRCGVTIGLPDATSDMDDLRARELRITGSAVANSLALLHLQWRLSSPSQACEIAE